MTMTKKPSVWDLAYTHNMLKKAFETVEQAPMSFEDAKLLAMTPLLFIDYAEHPAAALCREWCENADGNIRKISEYKELLNVAPEMMTNDQLAHLMDHDRRWLGDGIENRGDGKRMLDEAIRRLRATPEKRPEERSAT